MTSKSTDCQKILRYLPEVHNQTWLKYISCAGCLECNIKSYYLIFQIDIYFQLMLGLVMILESAWSYFRKCMPEYHHCMAILYSFVFPFWSMMCR